MIESARVRGATLFSPPPGPGCTVESLRIVTMGYGAVLVDECDPFQTPWMMMMIDLRPERAIFMNPAIFLLCSSKELRKTGKKEWKKK